MTTAFQTKKLTEEAYLTDERASEVKHEFRQGEVIDMAGASRIHAKLMRDIMVALTLVLKNTKYEVYSSEVHLHLDAFQQYTYPDIFICKPEAFKDDYVARDAEVVIEILSPSTEVRDRTEKLELYRSLKSIHEYVLVSQDKMQVEIYRKKTDREWGYFILTNPTDVLLLEKLEVSILLGDIYQSVEFKSKEKE
jgi:Uma2 family endonuclease